MPQSPDPPLRITGGKVIDPANGVNEVVREVCVVDGAVVDVIPSDRIGDVREINARGMIVMPGGVEMHAHLASGAVNAARGIQSAAGYEAVVPSAPETGRLYLQMGYTTGIEAAVAPGQARQTHMQLDAMPHWDTGLLALVGNFEPLLERIARDDRQGAAALLRHLLRITGAYGVKAVNPAAVAAWRRNPVKHHTDSIDDALEPGSQVSPRTVLETLTEIQEQLGLAHPTHIHGLQLGEPGNIAITLDMLRALAGRRLHLAHLQYYCYTRNKQGGFQSDVPSLLNHLSEHPQATADLGLVAFGPAFTATADLPLEHALYRHVAVPSKPASFFESGNEDCFGVMPLEHRPGSAATAVQWATGLELALLWDDPWRYALSIDHPNGGSFLNYPLLIALLMSKPRRDEMLSACHPAAKRHTGLAQITREMSLQEIAIITRAAPARALGLAGKGQLGVGADGDVTIYDDARDDPQAMFAAPRWVIQAGRVMVRDGEFIGDAMADRSAEAARSRRLHHAAAPDEHGQWLMDAWLQRHGSVRPGGYGMRDEIAAVV